MRLPEDQRESFSAPRPTITWPRAAVVVVLLCAATVCVGAAMRDEVEDHANVGNPAVARQNDAEHSSPPPRRFSVRIRAAAGPPRVATALQDAHGASVTVACSTCHTTRPPNTENRTVNELDEFHGGMAYSHGTVSCLSCHNSSDYDSLKLADGRRIEFSDVMTLCGQCHGPQLKDYEHGAHGGMNGYWDLTRGPRIKNNCVDCHHPHAPQFPKMQPTFKPRDRFLEPPRDEH